MSCRRYDLSNIFNYYPSCASFVSPTATNLPFASPAAAYPSSVTAMTGGCGCKNGDIGIFNQNAASTTALSNAPILVGQQTISGGEISYNATNGVYTVNSGGTYLFAWNLLVSGGTVTGSVRSTVITLENGGGGTVYATSGAVSSSIGADAFPAAESLTGFALVKAEAGSTFALYNRSGDTVTLVAAAGATATPSFAGTVTAVKIG